MAQPKFTLPLDDGERLFHSTPFGERVIEEGLKPLDTSDPVLFQLGILTRQAMDIQAELALAKAQQKGRAYSWARPQVDRYLLNNHDKLFKPPEQGTRPISLEIADSPDSVLEKEGHGYVSTSAGLGEKLNFVLGHSHRALTVFSFVGEKTKAEEVEMALWELARKSGIDPSKVPDKLLVTLFEVSIDSPDLQDPTTVRYTSLVAQELRVFRPISPSALTIVGEVEVPTQDTDLGRFLLGQEPRFYEIAGRVFR